MGRSSLWVWGLLLVALIATTALRYPLIQNARAHLDSDFAVDGLTLREALQGHWRWHYPGTPHIGTASLALMLPVGLICGATPTALVVSGAVLWALVVISTFVLALRVFGARVAAWSLVPLMFSSTGMIWLSGRITGGHLLAVTWHAVAFLLLYEWLARGGRWRAALLGFWCGFGLWNDAMMLMTLTGLIPAGLVAAFLMRSAKGGVVRVVALLCGTFVVGLSPQLLGRWSDPYDAYNEQLAPIWKADVLRGHARILALDCLPRLIVGHRLPDFQAEPGGIGGDGRPVAAVSGIGVVPVVVVLLGSVLFPLAICGLAFRGREGDPPRRAVCWGLLITTLGVLAAFVVNRNIYNSDNYRYLSLLIVPWALGFGRTMDWLARKGQGGKVSAVLIGLVFAVLFACDAAVWYRRLGWLDERGRPVAPSLDDPILAWLTAHPEVDSLGGDYWDVYRYAFLRGGGVKGVPSPEYPNRFPEWSLGHPSHVLARATPIGAVILDRAVRDGGVILYRAGGGTIATWPASGR